MDGHFPGDSIVPGALLLAKIFTRLSVEMIFIAGIRQVRFMQPVRPMDRVAVDCCGDSNEQLRFECRVADEIVVRGSFLIKNNPDDD